MKKVYGYIFVPNAKEPVNLSNADLQAETLEDAEKLVQAICKQLKADRYLITM